MCAMDVCYSLNVKTVLMCDYVLLWHCDMLQLCNAIKQLKSLCFKDMQIQTGTEFTFSNSIGIVPLGKQDMSSSTFMSVETLISMQSRLNILL